MPRLLPLKIVTALALLAAPACAKKTPPPAVTVVEDEAPPPGADGGGEIVADPAHGRPQTRPQGKPLQLQASVAGLGDLLQLVKQATTAWNPKNPIDASAWVQAALLQFGYGPGLWNNLDLAGVMAIDSAFYLDAPTTDLRLVGSVAALNARAVMEGMPSGQRPQPLGNGMWELVQGDLRVLLREKPKALEFALTAADLERAAAVASAAGSGRRLKVHAADLPPGLLSADGFPGMPPGLRRQVSGVLREATKAALELDAGTDRDLVLELAADAPFERLGLSPLGPARAQPTALEGRLPAGPAFVVAIPWGSPELLHKQLDNFKKMADSLGGGALQTSAQQALAAGHALLDQVQNDVVFAVYLGAKGESTVVLAADVKSEDAARKAAGDLFAASSGAVTAFNALGGDKKDASFAVAHKPGSVKAGAAKADALTLGLPKNMAKESADLRQLLDSKQQIDLVALVAGGGAVLAIGPDARKLAADIGGGPRKTSLAGDAGLVLARAASKGCHFCVGIDPAGVARLVFYGNTTLRDDRARQKDLDSAAAVVTRIGGALGFGLKLETGHGALAGGFKKSLLVLSPADAAAVGKLWEFISGPAPSAADDKPLGGGSREDKPLGRKAAP